MTDQRLQQAASRAGRPKGKCAGGYVEIEAPAALVWDIVGDWRGWGEWNPLYTHTSGEPTEGGEIGFTVCVPGMKPMDASAVVYTYRAPDCFEYGLSNVAGLLKAFRFIDVEEITPGRCGVANGEIISGLLGRIVAAAAGAKVTEGLQAMNAKLKEIAESRVRRDVAG